MNDIDNQPNQDFSIDDFFNTADAQLLASYNIRSIEQLLGATKGLTEIRIFDLMSQGKEALQLLKEKIPQSILKKYIEFEDEHPTGLITD